LRKLMLLAAMLALALVAAAPAIAQVSQGFEEEDVESGGVAPKLTVKGSGSNVNQCAVVLQSGQSGNVQNAQGVVQYKGKVDDVEVEGSAILESPEAAVDCDQLIRQAAAAGPKAEAKAGKAEAKAEAPKAEAKAGKAEAKAELPKTGGVAGTASLLGLGLGALLMAGGLLARRLFR
jgi:LPXTG-motif cell wall-anchored protein